MIAIDGSCLCSAGNISAIVGEAKSKKTFLTTALVASAIAYRVKATQAFKNISNNITFNVLWLDTEQTLKSYWLLAISFFRVQSTDNR